MSHTVNGLEAGVISSWAWNARSLRGRKLAMLVGLMGLLGGCAVVGWQHWRASIEQIRDASDAAIADILAARVPPPEVIEPIDPEPIRQQDAARQAERLRWQHVMTTASWRRGESSPHPRTSREHRVADQEDAATAEHWAYQPLDGMTSYSAPVATWSHNLIDAYVHEQLTDLGQTPLPPARADQLWRRLCFDTLGLPPAENMQPSQTDWTASPHYEREVERLLADPAFGEKWARLWLDLARYADSNGYEEDEIRHHAYPYRDFVVGAMNADLPFDEFIRWQIAGDELAPDNPLAVAATGFCTAPPWNTFLPQPSERYDELDDIVSTIGAAVLGLSVGCARCHDHPYDAITSEEYYQLVSIFEPTRREVRYLTPDQGQAYLAQATPAMALREELRRLKYERLREDNLDRAELPEEDRVLLRQPIDPENERQTYLLSICGRCLMIEEADIEAVNEPLERDRERFRQLIEEITELESQLPPSPPCGLALAGSTVTQVPVLRGGSLEHPGAPVGPGFLREISRVVTHGDDVPWQRWLPPASDATQELGPRSALAHWLTDTQHGAGNLVARVIVNRLWQAYFGVGLVGTPSDFGAMGDPPQNAKLLDELARSLIDHDWSLKHIHRLILGSQTYRQSTWQQHPTARDERQHLAIVPRVRRLQAEMIRDAILSTSGALQYVMYGPSIQPAIPAEAIFAKDGERPADTWPTTVLERDAIWRRSIYVMLRRTNPVPLLAAFDAPSSLYSCDTRAATIVPQQTLALWNAPFIRSQAQLLAESVRDSMEPTPKHRSAPADDGATWIHEVFLRCLSRPPTPAEMDDAVAFLHAGNRESDLIQALWMSNEFLHID